METPGRCVVVVRCPAGAEEEDLTAGEVLRTVLLFRFTGVVERVRFAAASEVTRAEPVVLKVVLYLSAGCAVVLLSLAEDELFACVLTVRPEFVLA